MTILFLFLLGAAAAVLLWTYSKKRKRKALLSTTLTDDQRNIILDEVTLIRKLPRAYGAQLEGKVSLFLDQVEFIGCNGLEVTEEMQLSIAAQACLLVVNSPQWYDTLRTILIYPGAFRSRQQISDGYVVTEQEIVRTGESWARGPVVLSWEHSERGAQNHTDGQNVVLHEFAHQLDNLSGHTDGAPVMNPGQSLARWAQVFTSAYDIHVGRVERGQPTAVDAYGAEGPEEYFAVVVELFFENPSRLVQEEPDVYHQLSELFQLNPLDWE
ncbi:M90 family metallopeptidase [uncultured Litoreibacter sp.]|uniref:M90 family metallopeptidase n=1 Tax=uncultured Litoreibacter sp. TaxID=1392394 RepID=UPI002637CF3B|nr:M90 family metallopeptidase [uncultured Litoreibacter sp.]